MAEARAAADHFTDQLLITLQSLNSWCELRDGVMLTAKRDIHQTFSTIDDENTASNVLFGVIGEEIRSIWKVEDAFRPDLLREVGILV